MRHLANLILLLKAYVSRAFEILAKPTYKLLLTLQLVVTISIFAIIFSMIDFSTLLEVAATASWKVVTLAGVLSFIVPALTAWRWRQSCHIIDVALPYPTHLKMQMTSNFIGQVLPSYIGVEGVRIMLFGKQCGSFLSASMGAIMDRLFGVFALILVLFMTAPFHSFVPMAEEGRYALGLTSLAALGLGIVLLVFIFPVGSRVFSSPKMQRFRAIDNALGKISNSPAKSLQALCIALSIPMMSLALIGLLFYGLGVSLSIVELAVIVPGILFAMMIPLSIAGWGIREGAFTLFFGFVGVPVQTSLAVSLLFGFAIILANLPGGVMILRWGLPKRSTAQDEDDGKSNLPDTSVTFSQNNEGLRPGRSS